jgi:hypothetical protein
LRICVRVAACVYRMTRATNRTIVRLRKVCRVPTGDGDAGDDHVRYFIPQEAIAVCDAGHSRE